MPVVSSWLTQRTYRAASCGLLTLVSPEDLAQSLDFFRNCAGATSGIRASGFNDLSFLGHIDDLLYLEVVDCQGCDVSPLHQLRNLRGLRLENPGCGLDFSHFPRLEVFEGDWEKSNRNVSSCTELRTLRVWGLRSEGDLQFLDALQKLEWLELVRPSIESLGGIERLEDLRVVKLFYPAKLKSIEALRDCTSRIRDFEMQNAKKVESYEPLGSLKGLRWLVLTACGPMDGLSWIRAAEELEFFSFVDTDIVDGDLRPILDLQRLRGVGTLDKRHYNIKFEELRSIVEARHGS